MSPRSPEKPVRLHRIRVFEGDRRALLDLFHAADDSVSQIMSYIALGDVLVATAGDRIVGHIQIVGGDEAYACEIKSLAVAQDSQRRGVGSALIAAALRRADEGGCRRIVVATAAADIGNLRFYQRRGFRMTRVVRDAFGPEKGYAEGIAVDGIVLRDQVILERVLR